MTKMPLFFMALLFGCILFVGCKKQLINKENYHLKMNECTLLANENSTLCFDSLSSDSRCLVDGVCVCAGVAIATFSLHKKEDIIFFTLATNAFSHFRNDTTINKIKISLQHITPYPNATQPSAAHIIAVIKIN